MHTMSISGNNQLDKTPFLGPVGREQCSLDEQEVDPSRKRFVGDVDLPECAFAAILFASEFTWDAPQMRNRY
jgi:hypothetical protein